MADEKKLVIKKVVETTLSKTVIEESIKNLTSYLKELNDELSLWETRKNILLDADKDVDDLYVEEKYKSRELKSVDIVEKKTKATRERVFSAK